MNFKREKIKDFYLRDTQVENIFITEYMADAEGDFVKVYLTALMYADHEEMSNSLIARHLGITEEDVLRAWNYWEKCGVIKKHYRDPEDRFHYAVEFASLKERLYGTAVETEEPQQTDVIPDRLRDEMDDEVVRDTFQKIQNITNRLLEGKEPAAVMSWIADDGLSPELICFAYKYCVEKRGNNKFSYISAVIREWEKENIRTLGDAEKYLQDTDLRHNQYRRVMRALGFHRNPTENEQSKMDTWFDDMGFGIEKVLEACARTSGISNPNINYVNSILTAWNNGGGKTAAKPSSVGAEDGKKNAVIRVKKLYEETRRKNENLLEERRRSIYESIPRIRDIENELRRASLEISRLALTGTGGSGVTADALRQKITDLNGEKAYLLTEQNLPHDYLELQYDCTDCRDTGVLENGERCKCFSEKLKLYI